MNYNNSTPEPSEFSTRVFEHRNPSTLYWCYLLPEDGKLLLGRVRARTPWALNLALGMGIVGSFFGPVRGPWP